MATKYYETIQLIERLHRYFLDVVKAELDRLGVQDINNVQAMILYNIGHDEMTVGELTLRGYYLGSNVSYNLKKMVEMGYVAQERSPHDKRSIRIKLTDKGIKLCDQLAAMFKRHEGKIAGSDLTDDKFTSAMAIMKQLERFWTQQSSFSGLASIEDLG
jgi:DNA-binding MarR family transcriptional regulator